MLKMNVKRIISVVLNVGIFGLVVMSTVFMMTGYEFMGHSLSLTASKVEAFKFFTVDSNILMGVIAFVFAIFEILVLCGKKEKIPSVLYTLYLMGAVGVVLTFLTTACFLAPFLVEDYWSLFTNSNLFFHFVVPVMSLLVFVFMEDTDVIKFKGTFIGIIPMVIYAIFYSATAISHSENGVVPYEYDWYGFVQGGLINAFFVLPIMLIAVYLISFLLWFLNRKINKLYSRFGS